MPGSGKPDELLAAAGIDREHIADAARQLVRARALRSGVETSRPGRTARWPSLDCIAFGARTERVDRLPLARHAPLRRARPAPRRRRRRRRHLEPDHLPEGDLRRRRLRRAASPRARGRARLRGALPPARGPRRRGCVRRASPRLGRGRRPGRLRLARGRPDACLRHGRHDRRGSPPARARRPSQPVREDPGDCAGPARDRGDDRAWQVHQRHADLRARALRRGCGGVHPRARAPRRGRRRSLRRRLGRELLRLARRHGGRPPPRGGRRPGDLQGLLAVANAKLAYQRYLQIFAGERWELSPAAAPRPSAASGPRPRRRTPLTSTSSTSRS